MSIYDDLQAALSSHRGEMALFARDLRQVGNFHSKAISTILLLNKFTLNTWPLYLFI